MKKSKWQTKELTTSIHLTFTEKSFVEKNIHRKIIRRIFYVFRRIRRTNFQKPIQQIYRPPYRKLNTSYMNSYSFVATIKSQLNAHIICRYMWKLPVANTSRRTISRSIFALAIFDRKIDQNLGFFQHKLSNFDKISTIR